MSRKNAVQIMEVSPYTLRSNDTLSGGINSIILLLPTSMELLPPFSKGSVFKKKDFAPLCFLGDTLYLPNTMLHMQNSMWLTKPKNEVALIFLKQQYKKATKL